MNLDHLKRMSHGFSAIPDEYRYFCRRYRGRIAVPAAVLRAYVFASRSPEDVHEWSDAQLAELLMWDWDERVVAEARNFLVMMGLLRQAGTGKRGVIRIRPDFALLSQMESSIPSDWRQQLARASRPRRYGSVQKCTVSDRQPVQKCTDDRHKNVPISQKTDTEMYRSQNLSLYTELREELEQEEKLASATSPPLLSSKRKDLASHLRGIFGQRQYGGKPLDARTVNNIVSAIMQLAEPLWPSILRKLEASRSKADTWGYFVHLVREDGPHCRPVAPIRSAWDDLPVESREAPDSAPQAALSLETADKERLNLDYRRRLEAVLYGPGHSPPCKRPPPPLPKPPMSEQITEQRRSHAG